jgi:hypothetical protein
LPPLFRLKIQIENINRFWEGLYGKPRPLSRALRRYAINDTDLDQLEDSQAGQFVDRLLAAWTAWMGEIMKARSADILVRHYGLTGAGRKTLADLGRDYNVTRERIRQVHDKALEVLREPANQARMQEIAEQLARELLA